MGDNIEWEAMALWLRERDHAKLRFPSLGIGKQSFCGGVSQAGVLVVIHKRLKPVIPAWTAGIQSQGGESAGRCLP